MAAPRKKYRPKPVNPTVHLLAMQGASRLSDADRLQRTNDLDAAVRVACLGQATRDDWALIVDCLNMAEMFARNRVGAGRKAIPQIEELQERVELMLVTEKLTGAKALYPAEKEVLKEFAEEYSELLAGVTHRQYFEAQEAAENRARRILAGERIPAGRVLEC